MKLAKKFVVIIAMMAVLLSTTACSKGGEENGTLNLFIWTEYIPDSVIQGFEKETGIKVQMQTYTSNEEMYAKVKGSNEGTYDLVCPSDYMVENMISNNMLQEVDLSKISNLGNIDPAYLNQSFDKNNAHSVPYLGGAVVLVYNKKLVPEGADFSTYNELFKPAYKNSLVILDDFRAIIGITAVSMGYDLNETDETKLEKVKEKLLTLKPNVKSFDSDSPKSLMITEETSAGLFWSGDAAIALQENPNLEIALPKEGMYLFQDSLCIMKGAKNSENAYKFINYVLRAEVNKQISTEFPYLNPNKAGIALMDDAYRNNKAIMIPPEEIAIGHRVKNIGKTANIYNEIWAELTK